MLNRAEGGMYGQIVSPDRYDKQRKEEQIMTNEYEVPVVVELAKAEDIVLGEKRDEEVVDSLTSDWGLRFIPSTED
jgi:hypothetical protein